VLAYSKKGLKHLFKKCNSKIDILLLALDKKNLEYHEGTNTKQNTKLFLKKDRKNGKGSK
jgi:hypothetical protein